MKPLDLAVLCLAPVLATAFAAGCGDDSSKPSPATTASTQTSAASATTAAASSTTTQVSTAPPSATATKSASATPAETIPAPANASTAGKSTAANPASPANQPLLKDVRIGIHPEQGGWDRIVFEFLGGLPAAKVEYVPSASQCGSGQPVTVPGTKVLSVRFDGAAAHNEAGQPTFAAQSITGPGTTILGAKQFCDFEGIVAWAVGIDSQKAFAVSTFANPPRLVVDVKH